MKLSIHITDMTPAEFTLLSTALNTYGGKVTTTAEPAAPAEEPKPKQRRGKKAKAEPAPKAEPAAAEETKLTLDDVRAALKKCVKAKKTDQAQAVLTAHGAESLPQIKPAQFAEIIADLEALAK